MILIMHALISDFNPVWSAYASVSNYYGPKYRLVFGTLVGPPIVQIHIRTESFVVYSVFCEWGNTFPVAKRYCLSPRWGFSLIFSQIFVN